MPGAPKVSRAEARGLVMPRKEQIVFADKSNLTISTSSGPRTLKKCRVLGGFIVPNLWTYFILYSILSASGGCRPRRNPSDAWSIQRLSRRCAWSDGCQIPVMHGAYKDFPAGVHGLMGAGYERCAWPDGCWT